MTRFLALLAVFGSFGAQAAYPERPIKMIVPWAAGGDTDNIFRPFGQVLQKHLGQTVVIANVGGASGTRGAKEAKDSPPDGYSLYAVHDYIHSTYYAGVADVQYTDFEPICLISSTPSVLTASPKTPWKIHEGPARRREEASGTDHGRRHARLDQPFLSGADREGERGEVQVRLLRGPRAAHERDPRRPRRSHRLQPHPERQGRGRAAQIPRHRHREAPPGDAERADAEGARRERGVRREPRHHGAEGHAGRRDRQARFVVRRGGEGARVRAGDEAAGHRRALHGSRRVHQVAEASRSSSTATSQKISAC